jgi:hypothetical protein
MIRKENDEKLHDVEDKEELEKDCKNINEITNKYDANKLIRKDFIIRLEELKSEYMIKNPLSDYYIANKVFNFLKDKA